MKHFDARSAPIDLNRLGVFSAVAEARSFAGAAKALRVQRSSVSRSIAALEKDLSVALFARTTRHVALTAEGAALYADVAPHLRHLRDTVNNLPTANSAPSGTLRLTASVDFGTHLLAPIVASFVRRFPDVRVELIISNRVVNLVKEGFDAALRPQPAGRADSTLVSRRVLDLDGGVYASPVYLAAHGAVRTLEELAEADWVSFRGLGLPGVRMKKAARVVVDEMLFVREVLRAGVGVGLLPTLIVGNDVATGRLVRLLPKQSVFRGGLYLLHPPTRQLPPRVRAFRDHLLVEAQGSAMTREPSQA